MCTKRYRFSLIEIIIVAVILALVMSLAVSSMDKSQGEIQLEVQDSFKTLFNNASIRAQAFNRNVTLSFIPDENGHITCTLKSKENVAPLITAEESEEEYLKRMDKEASVQAWSGVNKYDDFHDHVLLKNYTDFLNEEGEIHFHFYPDGEATGPLLEISILDKTYSLTVGRLNGQLQLLKGPPL